MDERERAFNEHFTWWLRANAPNIAAGAGLEREQFAKGAAASAWNAALAWAATAIGEKRDSST